MKQRTITVRIICLALLICLLVPAAAGCKKGTSDLKIGVLWEDDTSGESAAWAKYLRSLAKEYGFKVYAADLWSVDSLKQKDEWLVRHQHLCLQGLPGDSSLVR